MRFLMIPNYSKHKSMEDGYEFDFSFLGKKDEHKHEHEEMPAEYHREVSPGMKCVKKVLMSPPDTWKQYQGKPDGHFKIVEMESAELQNAHTAYKTGTKTKEDVMREFAHTAAACIASINALMK